MCVCWHSTLSGLELERVHLLYSTVTLPHSQSPVKGVACALGGEGDLQTVLETLRGSFSTLGVSGGGRYQGLQHGTKGRWPGFGSEDQLWLEPNLKSPHMVVNSERSISRPFI